MKNTYYRLMTIAAKNGDVDFINRNLVNERDFWIWIHILINVEVPPIIFIKYYSIIDYTINEICGSFMFNPSLSVHEIHTLRINTKNFNKRL